MPTITAPHSSEYVSLRDYIDKQLEARDKATEIAYATLEKRLEGMNEFRSALRDQGLQFLTKAEYTVYKESVDSDLRMLRESRAALAGKADQRSVMTATVIAVLGLALGIIGILMRLQ